MPEWANYLVIFLLVATITYLFGQKLRPFIEEVIKKGRRFGGVGLGKPTTTQGGNPRPKYLICTSCLQGYIHQPDSCKNCGKRIFVVVDVTGKIRRSKEPKIEDGGRLF
jgi:hypothetical protein